MSLVAVGLIMGVTSARANHIPGATYTGTHSGGGTVEFVVTPDGASVNGFTVRYPPDTCRFPVWYAGSASDQGRLVLMGASQRVDLGARIVHGPPDRLWDSHGRTQLSGLRSARFTWTARTTASPPDTTPPDTTIADGPAGPTRTKAPSFTFTSTEAGATFDCRIDDGAFAACSSPFKTATLTDGPHTFEVRATDQAANTDPTPATRSFVVDATAPRTIITVGPTGKTTNRTPRFAFRSNEPGSTFRCRLDGKAWVTCRSPKQYGRLRVGRHTFDVQATDRVGNRDASPARRSFRLVVR